MSTRMITFMAHSRSTRRILLSLPCSYNHSVFKRLESSNNCKSQTLKEGRHFREKHLANANHMTQIKRPYQIRKVNIKNIFDDENSQVISDQQGRKAVSGDNEQEDQEVSPRVILDSASLKDFQSKLADSEELLYSHEDWEKLKENTLSENPNLKKSWETTCMQLMYHYGQTSLASSFIEYLNSGASSPNLSTLCLFVALQGKHGKWDKEGKVEETYRSILKMTDVFDSITAKYLIVGLSCTSLWRQALDILDMVKLTNSPGRAYYSPIVAAAVREQDTDLAFELLEEMALKGLVPQDIVLHEVLRACQSAESHQLLERYFVYVWKYSWYLSPSAAQEVELYFTRSQKDKWICKWTSVNTVRGVCHQCKHGLQRIELCTADFEAMQRQFMERAVLGDNVYLQSSPKEVDAFKDFVMEHAPFDVVLDALNIAFKGQGRSSGQKSKQLRNMVHYFARERHMKVLVIGRAHMTKWPQADMAYINRQAKTFFTDNISSDDPFCLYATLYSGQDCLFVSGDFMRNHKHNLGPQFKETFERWQKSRQIVNFTALPTGISIVMPSQYDCGPVKDSGGWHIPYDDGNADLRSSSQSVLCLRHKGPRKTPARSSGKNTH